MSFIGFVFACFVFASVFISDEGEPSRVCQAPFSMQAIISASFEVNVCVCVCVHCGVWGMQCGCSKIYLHSIRVSVFCKGSLNIPSVLTLLKDFSEIYNFEGK